MKIFIGISLLILILTGCKNNEEQLVEDTNTSKVYYINESGTKIVSEDYELTNVQTEDIITEYLTKIIEKPQNSHYKSAIPENLIIKNIVFNEGQLSLYFDSAYESMSKITEILCRAVIVKTLCQVEEIKYMDFYVNDQPLMDANEKPIGLMSGDKFIDNTANETSYYQRAYITLFFANSDGTMLIEHVIPISYNGNISMEKLIMNKLIDPGLDYVYPTISEGTKLVKITVKDGICYVDLNEKFLEKTLAVRDSVTIYSIVNSLVENPNINKVQFTINGEKRKTFRESNLVFDGVFERNLDIVESQEDR